MTPERKARAAKIRKLALAVAQALDGEVASDSLIATLLVAQFSLEEMLRQRNAPPDVVEHLRTLHETIRRYTGYEPDFMTTIQ